VALFDVAQGTSEDLFPGAEFQFSPDGKWIALSYQGAICRMPGNGGMLTRLTSGEGFDGEPAWSPDGAWIAYHTQADAFPNVGESSHFTRPLPWVVPTSSAGLCIFLLR
jgi:Tol biopolymer transport system component